MKGKIASWGLEGCFIGYSMSKRFKNKTCVYCAREGISSTGDHVFAREFFPVEKRANLPIVPACTSCNNTKSTLEHYLTAVLPFGGLHPDASPILSNEVPRRLARNKKLHNNLREGSTTVDVREDNQQIERFAVPFESNRLVKLFGLIARALSAYHWNVVIPADYIVEPLLLNPIYEADFRRMFLMQAAARVQGDIGDGAFLYQGAQAVDDPALTIWRFRAFGGIVVADDEQVPEASAPTIWVTTSRN